MPAAPNVNPFEGGFGNRSSSGGSRGSSGGNRSSSGGSRGSSGGSRGSSGGGGVGLVGGGGGFSLGGFGLGGLTGITGAGLGLNLLGGLLKTRSERARLKNLRRRLLGELAPMETLLRGRQAGLTRSEGFLTRSATGQALSDLARRGVLTSSIAAPAVAQAVAPIELQRERDIQDLLATITSARQQIFTGTSLPGFGAAFGGAFGETGDILSFIGGLKAAGVR